MRVEIRARKIAIGIGAADQREEIVFAPVFGGARGHDLLRQNVERRFGNDRSGRVRLAASARTSAAHSTSSSRVVAKMRPLGIGAAPVAGAADALQRDGNRARRADLADQIDVADIDSQFERRRRHERAQFARFQLRFGGEPQLARQAAVVRGHRVFAEHARPDDAPRARPAAAC